MAGESVMDHEGGAGKEVVVNRICNAAVSAAGGLPFMMKRNALFPERVLG